MRTSPHLDDGSSARLGVAAALSRIRLEQLGFWRNRQRAFFSFLMPVVLLVLLGELDRHRTYAGLRVVDWQVPGLLTFGLAAAIYNNLAVTVVEQRESGILKRLRATPLPPRIFVIGQVGSSLAAGLCLTVVFVSAARALFGIGIAADHVAAFVVTTVIGAGCFAALGLAVTSLIRSAEAAVPVVNATYIPLALVSGVFFPGQGGPPWLVSATRAMPMRALSESFQACFAAGHGLAFRPLDLVVILAWTAAGAACAARFFRWTPARSAS
jgi:ABC-2 type transport system permease protein